MTPSPPARQHRIDALPVLPVAVVLSCLFSLLVILQNPLLNNDAYLYLRAAEVFNASGALAVLETYGWFNYSFLIALFDQVLPGGPIAAAHMLNTACYALLTWSFIRLSRELRAAPRVQLFAALCILAFPLTNEMRYFLIRDTGFWAFALLSLVLLLRFRSGGQLRMAVGWCLALCVAIAFRLEGLLLMMLAPLSLLLPDGVLALPERARRFTHLLGVLVAVLAGVLVLTLAAGVSLIELIAFAYRWYLPQLADLFTHLTTSATGVNATLFTAEGAAGSDNVALGVIVVLFGDALTLLLNVVNALSVPVVVLMLATRWRLGAVTLPQGGYRVLQAYIGSSMLALVLFVLIMHFMTQRYATLVSLLLLSLVPLMLDDLYARAQQAGTLRRFHAVLGFFCFYYLVDSLLSFGYSHRHIEEGIAWSRDQLPANAVMRTNNFAIAYHSGHVVDYDKTVRDAGLVMQSSISGDYLVLDVDSDDIDMLDTNPVLVKVNSFANERGDEVRIYLRR
jgi:hypothetical protein